MKNVFTVACSFLLFICQAQKTYIHCGILIDTKTATTLNNHTIVVEKNKIVDVVKGFIEGAATDKTINLKNATVMPGLMDCHVHVEEETSPNGYINKFTQNPPDIAFSSLQYVEKTLMAGFTTVRDLGGSGVNISLRNAIAKGLVVGPRVYTAGKSIATTGGHADPTNGYRKELMGDPGPKEGVVNGADDCYKAVRQRYKDGSDVIKITASGGVLSVAKSGENPQFTDAELNAIVAAAKDYGFKVAAHCHGAEAMKRAVVAGVNSIEHGTYMTEEVMELMKQKNCYLVPTITAGKSVADSAKKAGYYNDLVTPKALAIGPKIQGTFGKAYKMGVPIAFGTDAGVFAHGKNWMEFVYMNEAGMPAIETIVAATIKAADLIGISDILGSIEKNKLADIVAVSGNPLQDMSAMKNVVFVMKDGKVYKQ
jgi:imidazolonepropionase-like amidohydrolase